MYYGCQPGAGVRAKLDSFALHRGKAYRASRPTTTSFGGGNNTQSVGPQMYTSAQLGGFETSTPVTGYQGGPVGGTTLNNNSRNSTARYGTGAAATTNTTIPQEPEQQVTEYPYRAKAIYSYEANPDDANEISFSKHEILEVSDVSGRWWQAKKENGETGIAPSNYLILL
jgi:SHO1 osmosensor